MIISIALPHIYLVASEPFSFAVWSRSQYYFPLNYTVWSPRFSRGNWLDRVTAGSDCLSLVWGWLCSALQPHSPPSGTEPCLCCSAPQNKALSCWDFRSLHETPSAGPFGQNGQGWIVCGVGHWDTSSDTQVAPGGFISLMRGMKAVTILFIPQQVICAIPLSMGLQGQGQGHNSSSQEGEDTLASICLTVYGKGRGNTFKNG